jgi:hypothetical protein
MNGSTCVSSYNYRALFGLDNLTDEILNHADLEAFLESTFAIATLFASSCQTRKCRLQMRNSCTRLDRRK